MSPYFHIAIYNHRYDTNSELKNELVRRLSLSGDVIDYVIKFVHNNMNVYLKLNACSCTEVPISLYQKMDVGIYNLDEDLYKKMVVS